MTLVGLSDGLLAKMKGSLSSTYRRPESAKVARVMVLETVEVWI